jgi:monovalent cation:proton antiporter-2 (CPA2) family protein
MENLRLSKDSRPHLRAITLRASPLGPGNCRVTILEESIIYLLAAIISVPISKRLGFGSVLGYLCAGILIGPFGFGFIHEPEHILHFAELGVVFLLFIIGLELKPSRLWIMRKMVFGLGTAQVVVSAAVIAVLAWFYGLETGTSIVIGLILALSSTAFVLQMLAEKRQLSTQYGRAAFSILLLQDLAVIPLIALLPLLGARVGVTSGFDVAEIALVIGTMALLIVGGRLVLKPVLYTVAAAGIPELFTATALLVVIGSALLMDFAGMSMVLGAFLAGMLLADSEYRHQLEADIAPFKGLLLGLFFIAVGMSVNVNLLLEMPGRILLFVAGIMASKAIVLVVLARLFGMCDRRNALSLAAVMSQGGEFAFVLFALAARERLVPLELIDELILAVAVSMLLTPFVYLLNERFSSRLGSPESPRFDDIPEEDHEVIIAGFGRVGQIVGRLLQSINKPFTALEIDSSQVDIVRRYGNSVHFGDAARSRRKQGENTRPGHGRHGDLTAHRRDRKAPVPEPQDHRARTQPPARSQAHGRGRPPYLPRYAVIESRDGRKRADLARIRCERGAPHIRHVPGSGREAAGRAIRAAGLGGEADPVREGRREGTRVHPRTGPAAPALTARTTADGRAATHRYPKRDDLAW